MRRFAVAIAILTAAFFAAGLMADEGGEGKATKYVVGSGPAKKEATKKSENDTLVITARILEIPGTFPPNDLYNYVYVMKYRVLAVEKGAFEGKEILVGQYNPLIPRAQIKDKMDAFVDGDVDKFEEGAKHRLVLVTPIDKVWQEAMEDEYFDSEMTKYYCFKADMVK